MISIFLQKSVMAWTLYFRRLHNSSQNGPIEVDELLSVHHARQVGQGLAGEFVVISNGGLSGGAGLGGDEHDTVAKWGLFRGFFLPYHFLFKSF